MSGAVEFHRVRRQVAERLAAIRFADRSTAGLSDAERERVWADFYAECPDDLAYLVDSVDVLVDWIVSAASVAVQIRDKRGVVSEAERESAICELAGFLEARVEVLSEASHG